MNPVDIIQAITFGTREGIISFPGNTGSPHGQLCDTRTMGYAGIRQPCYYGGRRFCPGIVIELSADGPVKPPYAVYFQGGLTWYHAKLGILKSLQQLLDDGVLKILR